MKKPPTSLLSRSAKLLRAGAKMASQEIKQRAKNKISEKVEQAQQLRTRMEQVKVLTKALGELKGSAMKFGQFLSIEAQDWLPPEILDVLAQLQKDAPLVDPQVMFDLARDQIGDAHFSDLNLDHQPIAMASIGQVFRGTLNNQPIVTKIQYPGIWNSVDSDIMLLKGLTTTFARVLGKKINFEDVFEEIRFVLHQEVDYHLESRNLMEYREIFADRDDYRVPRVLTDYSSQRVLTMSFEQGRTLKEWIDTGPSKEDKLKVAEMVQELFFIEFFDNGIVQTDPNFANFLVQEGPIRLVLLDCGAVLRYDLEFRESYRHLLKLIMKGEKDSAVEYAVSVGMLDHRESLKTKQLYQVMLEKSIAPFRPENQPFEFFNRNYSSDLREAVLDFTKSVVYSPPPRRLVFLHRKLGGVFNLLKMMGVSMDLTPYWDRIDKGLSDS